MPHAEPWPRIYRERPDIFAAFCRAEDPEGRIVGRLRALADLEGATAVEVGCGTGRYTAELARACGRYVATDPSPALLGLAGASNPGLALVRARAEALPFRDRGADRFLATWVLAYLRPAAREAAVDEALRVLRPGGAAWLVENHWEGDFQELRDCAGYGAEPGVKALLETHGFQVAERLETELRFDSAGDAEAILGALCGEAVAAKLRRSPRARFGHAVVLLRRPA
ncbi:MAG: class I SAM-dependent methyltransferase [Holophagaceae bacterium]